MGVDDLIDLLFKQDNRKLQRWIGGVLVALPLVFIFGGGFSQEVDGHGRLFSGGWFREVFVVALGLFGFLGVLLLMVSFSERKNVDDEE